VIPLKKQLLQIINFNFLVEFERALVLFQLRNLKIKRARGYRFDKGFLILFCLKKEYTSLE